MKSLLMASSVLILSIASLFTQSEVNISFKSPESVVAGMSYIMEIEVDKGDISNFAKLQLSLPEGFTAELLNGEGGTFTFYDQKIKLIWISLPADPKFIVQIKVNTESSIQGDFNFNGKISYIIDGDRKSSSLVTPNITVAPNTGGNENPSPIANSSGTTGTPLNTVSQSAELTCKRKFDAEQIVPGETFLVEIEVDKNNVSGVGKIVESLPEGFVAGEVEANGAIFSQKGNEVKFLWMTLPAEDIFTVSYKINVSSDLNGNKVIDGKMSYLDGSETKNFLIDGTTIKITNTPSDPIPTDPIVADPAVEDPITNDPIAANPVVEDPITTDPIAANPVVEDPITTDPIAANPVVEDPITTDPIAANPVVEDPITNDPIAANPVVEDPITADPITADPVVEDPITTNPIAANPVVEDPITADSDPTQSITASTNNNNNVAIANGQVNYRVQICALRKKVTTDYFVKSHQINEKIYLNMHQGWHKYTVGNFNQYVGARDHREDIRNNKKIKGPFVTAYNNGTRITVQEALMITKDKWVQ